MVAARESGGGSERGLLLGVGLFFSWREGGTAGARDACVGTGLKRQRIDDLHFCGMKFSRRQISHVLPKEHCDPLHCQTSQCRLTQHMIPEWRLV
jgi:hypothetical protein